MNFEKHIEAARKSKFGLRKLNWGLFYIIPFNRPHGIKVVEIQPNLVITEIPYKRKNLNHIKGVHACGLATCAEFASGLLLLTKLGSKKYRLIMESLEMKYHYQAKTRITARFEISDEWMDQHIFQPLETEDLTYVKCQIELYDEQANHVATGFTNWQIKNWDKVKTKI